MAEFLLDVLGHGLRLVHHVVLVGAVEVPDMAIEHELAAAGLDEVAFRFIAHIDTDSVGDAGAIQAQFDAVEAVGRHRDLQRAGAGIGHLVPAVEPVADAATALEAVLDGDGLTTGHGGTGGRRRDRQVADEVHRTAGQPHIAPVLAGIHHPDPGGVSARFQVGVEGHLIGTARTCGEVLADPVDKGLIAAGIGVDVGHVQGHPVVTGLAGGEVPAGGRAGGGVFDLDVVGFDGHRLQGDGRAGGIADGQGLVPIIKGGHAAGIVGVAATGQLAIITVAIAIAVEPIGGILGEGVTVVAMTVTVAVQPLGRIVGEGIVAIGHPITVRVDRNAPLQSQAGTADKDIAPLAAAIDPQGHGTGRQI